MKDGASDDAHEVLREVHDRIVERGSVGESDISALAFWQRLPANTPWAGRLLNTPESDVRTVTGCAVVAVQDRQPATREAGVQAPRYAQAARCSDAVVTARLGTIVVERVITDLAVVDVTEQGLRLTELAPDVTEEQVRAATGAPLLPAPGAAS